MIFSGLSFFTEGIMMILCFDLSLSCTGYSIFDDDGTFIKKGFIETNGKDSTPLRLETIAKQMRLLKKKYEPDVVVIERGFYRFAGSSEQIWRVHGVTNLIFSKYEQVEIHATSVRKLVAGKGNMKKLDFYEYIRKEYPSIEFANGDEIDSFALGIAYLEMKGVILCLEQHTSG